MSLTHEDARRLIQYNLDNALEADGRAALANHLDLCESCRDYTREIREVESIVQTAMKKRWILHPLPLSRDAVPRRQIASRSALATRFAMVGMFFALAIFSLWQIGTLKPQENKSVPVAVLSNPTPSLQPTTTQKTPLNCENPVYTVQSGDTLQGIARRFSVNEAAIQEINKLDKEPLRANMDLVIPICSFTPPITAHAPTFSTTLTPLLQPTTYTPDQ